MKTVIFNSNVINEVKKNGPVKLVWANELVGGVLTNQKPVFTEESKSIGLEAIILDSYTASAMVKVMGALSEGVKEKVIKRIDSDRAYFGMFVEQVWNCVK
ncbi:hypothetical protein F7Q91_24585 [Vibrio chagasii]|uniref:Uncharacterized protein n=1 Tax=Vibrio chagasii TaxID=170679 RepID=A0A7V7TE74_9VIBR|nr:hypothetical protein [Vibrio chagasii]KAB0464988.1 hypothetical protein F7Q91_24585 [Vibrio chagasii]